MAKTPSVYYDTSVLFVSLQTRCSKPNTR